MTNTSGVVAERHPPRISSIIEANIPSTSATNVLVSGAQFGTHATSMKTSIGGTSCQMSRWVSDSFVRQSHYSLRVKIRNVAASLMYHYFLPPSKRRCADEERLNSEAPADATTSLDLLPDVVDEYVVKRSRGVSSFQFFTHCCLVQPSCVH